MDYLDPDVHCPQKAVKVAEDDIAFKLAIFLKIIAFEQQYMLL